jgi:opacity protein-like surface antigen
VRARLLLFVWLVAWLSPAAAEADWLITPFVGVKFAGDTNLIDLDQAAGEPKLVIGGSAALLGAGLLGAELDVGYSPRFFERSDPNLLVRSSSVTTIFGSVLVAVPLAVTRESLRPYAVGGLGLIHAETEDVLDIIRIDSNLFGLAVGGGIIGALSDRTSVRLDLRHFRTLSREGEAVLVGTTRLSFWRASAGVTFRY